MDSATTKADASGLQLQPPAAAPQSDGAPNVEAPSQAGPSILTAVIYADGDDDDEEEGGEEPVPLARRSPRQAAAVRDCRRGS